MEINKEDISKMDNLKRINLINSINGIKSANLIASVSKDGKENIAIFSSVIHLGSNPAILGFIMRPNKDIPRHTYENIIETKYYTINSIPYFLIEKAHYTSIKFERNLSEFEMCNIKKFYDKGFNIPFVEESPIKIAMSFIEEINIKANDTILIVGAVEKIIINESSIIEENCFIRLDKLNIVGISGLNSYYKLEHVKDLPYARIENMPDFKY